MDREVSLQRGRRLPRRAVGRVRGIENALIAPSSSRTKKVGLANKKVGWTQHDTAFGARSTDIGATVTPERRHI